MFYVLTLVRNVLPRDYSDSYQCQRVGDSIAFSTLNNTSSISNSRMESLQILLNLFRPRPFSDISTCIRTTSMIKHWLLLSLLLSSGDIALIPGPVNNPCAICLRLVASNYRALQCDDCQFWTHIRCGDVTTALYTYYVNRG